jgi:DNA-directed RNA polymerase specialized sigma subunit
MEDITIQYNKQIETAINKYAHFLSSDQKDDVRQFIKLSLLSYIGELSTKLAADISRKRTIDYLRKYYTKFDDISDPNIIRKIDSKQSYISNIEVLLDSNKALQVLSSLSEPYKFVVSASFGIDSELSDKEIANILNKSIPWVYRTRQEGLKRLRKIMENK